VHTDRGPGGGCALRGGYRTDLTGLNEGEVASLFAGTVGRQLRDLGLGAGFQGAMAKLEAGLPSARRADAERARDRIHVDPTPWFTPHENTRHLPALRRAVLGDEVVRLTYQRPDGRRVERRTQPLGLVVKGGIWYLAGMTAGEPRVYRVSRLAAVAPTGERCERPRSFDLAAFWGRWSAELIDGIPQYHFKLRVEAAGVPVLPHVFGERVRPALASARRRKDGSVVIEQSMDHLDAAAGAVLRMGTLVEVIEPEELRTAVVQIAAAVLERYARHGASPRRRG
jgi:predicted DNA-binding transcriptional regulator YafY